MISLPNIDMAEVTRLTREGKLNEAMAVLQGNPVRARTAQGPDVERAARMVDMERSGPGWSMPGSSKKEPAAETAAESDRQSSKTGSKTNLFSAPFAEKLKRTVPAGTRTRSVRGAPVPAGATFNDAQFSGSAGTRPYKLYVPANYDSTGAPVPLIVMLHGCTQSPDDFAIGTRMNELAEEQGFLVVYPGQTQSANASKCWNWFSAKDQQRDGGEPGIIADIVRKVMTDHHIDPSRVFAAGLSAGGAAAAILGQRYPDLFAAIGVHSGLACGAAKDMPSAFSAMQSGGTAVGGHTNGVPAIVFHGDRDSTVAPVNGKHVLTQAKGTQRTTETIETGRSPGGVAYTRTIHRAVGGGDAAVAPVLEDWTLNGMGHAWSGGSAAGSYTDPRGPDASREMLRFFDEVTRKAA